MFITSTEWSTLYGGKRKENFADPGFKRLPFDSCALSLTPFETPMATRDGIVFDLVNIVPYVKKHGVNPVTGEPLRLKDMIKLHYHKSVQKDKVEVRRGLGRRANTLFSPFIPVSRNADGKYHDPVTFKIFTEHSHIVAIATSGNVYNYETIQDFNIKVGDVLLCCGLCNCLFKAGTQCSVPCARECRPTPGATCLRTKSLPEQTLLRCRYIEHIRLLITARFLTALSCFFL